MTSSVAGKTRTASLLPTALFVALVLVSCLLPLYWLFASGSMTTAQLFSKPPRFIPGTNLIENIQAVVGRVDLVTAGLNSLLVTVSHTALSIVLCSVVGFTFAHYNFRAKSFFFGIVLLTLIVPSGVLLVPQFQIYLGLGWNNTYWPLIIPGAAGAFGVFWFRQYAELVIPRELVEAATVDGCGLFRTYWLIALPLLRPAAVSFAVFTAIATWNDYLWPLIVLNDQKLYTLPIAIAQLSGAQSFTNYPAIMAGTALSVVPMLVVLIFARRHITESLAAGAVKG